MKRLFLVGGLLLICAIVNADSQFVQVPAASGGGTPGGSSGQIQYNNSGSFGGTNAYYSGSKIGIGISSSIPGLFSIQDPVSGDTFDIWDSSKNKVLNVQANGQFNFNPDAGTDAVIINSGDEGDNDFSVTPASNTPGGDGFVVDGYGAAYIQSEHATTDTFHADLTLRANSNTNQDLLDFMDPSFSPIGSIDYQGNANFTTVTTAAPGSGSTFYIGVTNGSGGMGFGYSAGAFQILGSGDLAGVDALTLNGTTGNVSFARETTLTKPVIQVQGAGSTPSSTTVGATYYTSAFVLCVYNGSGWVKAADGSTACTF